MYDLTDELHSLRVVIWKRNLFGRFIAEVFTFGEIWTKKRSEGVGGRATHMGVGSELQDLVVSADNEYDIATIDDIHYVACHLVVQEQHRNRDAQS